SDPESKIIRAFGIFNTNIPHDHEWYGVPFPGAYIVDANGFVRSKYFGQDHRERFTAESILTREYASANGRRMEVKTDHLKLAAYASQESARPGNRITLVIDIELPPKMHVYAPGVSGYRPVAFTIDSSAAVKLHDTEFPKSKVMVLEAIKERVPVFEGKVTIRKDVTISSRFRNPVLEIPAVFEYQACDDQICYVPQKLPLKFTLRMERHDNQRAPEDIRKKG
ncbi:MAG: hypothetical protein HY646_12435, partial [Acidobacteria bacterium]|nr:hypothetical protein [Acidobacteriota bacterium]